MKIIEAIGVSKSYHREPVLRNYNFEVKRGEFVLLVGTNGSGKTTLIRGLLGLIAFDSGTVRFKSRKIAYAPERFYFPEFIAMEDFLKLMLGTGNLDMLLEEWELQEARKKEFRKLSKGMKQKALLMQALYSDADILFFDEPLNGIDRHSAEKFVKKLAELKAKDKTIILSSHNPEFFQNLADKTVRMEVPE